MRACGRLNKVSRLEMARVLAGDKMKTDQPRLSLASCEGQKMKRREHGDQKKWREDDREEACMENATQETGALVGRVLDHARRNRASDGSVRVCDPDREIRALQSSMLYFGRDSASAPGLRGSRTGRSFQIHKANPV